MLDVEARWPHVEGVTYKDHPWPGWDGRSVDFWSDADQWIPAPIHDLREIRAYLMRRREGPGIRHTILRHRLWTSWAGYSVWASDDHSGRSLHLHVTYW